MGRHRVPGPQVSASDSLSRSSKRPRNRDSFRDAPCPTQKVSVDEDWVAVEGVPSELVSRIRSLLSRENTGNFFDSGRLKHTLSAARQAVGTGLHALVMTEESRDIVYLICSMAVSSIPRSRRCRMKDSNRYR